MQRRDLFKAAPAALLVGALPVTAASAPSPVRLMFDQWKDLSAWLNGPEASGLPEDEFNAVVDVRIDLENRMMAEPPQDAADALMMIAAYSEFGAGDVPCRAHLPKLWDQVLTALGEGGAA